MRYDPEIAAIGDPRTVRGELLCPGRFPEGAVKRLEERLTPEHASAQLGQRPFRPGGSIFKKELFRYYPQSLKPKVNTGLWIQSWDMAFKDKASSDFVAWGVWCADQRGLFLVDVWNERLSFTDTIARFRTTTEAYPQAFVKLIEDKANGTAVENVIQGEVGGCILREPEGKEAMAHACTPQFLKGKIWFPDPSETETPDDRRRGETVRELVHQLESFPRGSFDDLVDQLTQAVLYLAPSGDMFDQAMSKVP